MTTPAGHFFIETIRYTASGAHMLDLHNRRLRATQMEAFGSSSTIITPEMLRPPVTLADDAVMKCRVIYDTGIIDIQFEPYVPHPVSRLLTVVDDSIDYHLKYLDRTPLSYPGIPRRDDEGLIIIKNGFITDSTYANLLLHTPSNLYTPTTPLLPGVMRRHLLETGAAKAIDLRPSDILPGNPLGITHISFINAMLPPGTFTPIPVTEIAFRDTEYV